MNHFFKHSQHAITTTVKGIPTELVLEQTKLAFEAANYLTKLSAIKMSPAVGSGLQVIQNLLTQFDAILNPQAQKTLHSETNSERPSMAKP